MKLLLLLSLCLYPLLASAQAKDPLTEVIFRSETRGSWIELRLTSDLLYYQQSRRGEKQAHQRALAKEEWQQVRQSLQKVELGELEQLAAPTNKRAYDAAWHSRLSLHTTQNSYQSPFFDGQHPHKKLMPLMDQLRKLMPSPEEQE